MHISTITGPTCPHHPGRLPSTPFCADPGPRITTPGEKGSTSLSHRGSCWSVMMWAAGRGREDTRRPPFQVAGSRRPLVRPHPRGPPASAVRRAGPMGRKGRAGRRPYAQRYRGPVSARVYYAPFPLLRPLTLHCTRKEGVAEGEGAQQTGKGVADAKGRSGRPGAACVMRAQRDAVHPASHRASPTRQNPPELDSCEHASHNASPGDITNSTPPGADTRRCRRRRTRGHARRLPRDGGTHRVGRDLRRPRRRLPPRQRGSDGRRVESRTASPAPPRGGRAPAHMSAGNITVLLYSRAGARPGAQAPATGGTPAPPRVGRAPPRAARRLP